MTGVESLIWSAYTGAFAMLILGSVFVASYHRTVSSTQHVIWLAVCCLTSLSINGVLPGTVLGMRETDLHLLKIVSGPACVALSALWVRSWLGVRHRSRAIDLSLITVAVGCILLGGACLLLPVTLQFTASTGITLLGILALALLCLGAGYLGDQLAWLMASVAIVLLVVLGFKYALALGALQGLWVHVFVACGSIMSMMTASLLLWNRSHKEFQLTRNDRLSSQHDLMTGLDNGMTIVKKILEAQKRLKLRSAEGTVLAVMVLNLEALSLQVGLPGVQELLFRAAARVRRTSGLINPVGRYFDRCFIVVLETVRTPADAADMAAALKYSLTRPMEIQGLHGEMQSLTLEVSVGSVRLTHQLDVATVMHRVEQEACRKAGLPYMPMQNTTDLPIQTEAGDLSSQYG